MLRFLRVPRPRLSVVVVVYDMNREAPRTLYSLSAKYQEGMEGTPYEVVVVDNGSPTPLGRETVHAFGPHFHYYVLPDANPSPAEAINFGVSRSRGEVIGVMVDGARITTPGLLRTALSAFRTFDDPAVATLGWHLGPSLQRKSIQNGYDASEEDRLLESIQWPAAGYRLFEIAALAGSSSHGCFRPIAESNALFLRRKAFWALGGYDSRFDQPGGGLVNLDFFLRICESERHPVVLLPGEGTFHQIHGGISTNSAEHGNQSQWGEWAAKYERIRGTQWKMPRYEPYLLGRIPEAALPYIGWSAEKALSMKG